MSQAARVSGARHICKHGELLPPCSLDVLRCDLCKHCMQGLDYILAVAGSRKVKAWAPFALCTCLALLPQSTFCLT